jgi:hypothetical protein
MADFCKDFECISADHCLDFCECGDCDLFGDCESCANQPLCEVGVNYG